MSDSADESGSRTWLRKDGAPALDANCEADGGTAEDALLGSRSSSDALSGVGEGGFYPPVIDRNGCDGWNPPCELMPAVIRHNRDLIMTWMVQLTGDTADLAALAQSLTGADVNVAHDGQDYVLTSAGFQPSDDAQTIRQNAEQIVELLNGASRLALDATRSIRVGAVYGCRDDGTRAIFVFQEPAVIRVRAISPTVKMTYPDGTIQEFHPADPITRWMALALSDDSVAKVLRIISSGTLDWVNLYRIFENIAEDVDGIDGIASSGWATKPSMKLFKYTANSPGALGLDARHGAESTQAPSMPMTIAEARSLVNSIVHAWLRAKTGSGRCSHKGGAV